MVLEAICVYQYKQSIIGFLTYVDGGLLFVSSQDPDLNVGFHEGLDSFWYFVLKFVFNGCGPQQLQVLQRKRIYINNINKHQMLP